MSFFEFKNQKTDPTKILGENIASLRKKAGMTQEELAARLHITYQAVSKWENGKACPDPAFLPVLADLFNVSIDFLFGRETCPTNHKWHRQRCLPTKKKKPKNPPRKEQRGIRKIIISKFGGGIIWSAIRKF